MRIQKNTLVAALLFCLAACSGTRSATPGATDPSPSDGGTVSAVISATDGGFLTSSDGKLTLTVPAGALDEDTEITITPVKTDEGTVYDFQPEGLVFNEPATADFEMDASEMEEATDEDGNPLDTGNVIPSVLLFLVNEDGTTEVLEDISVFSEEDSSVLHVSASIPHFTGLVGSAGNASYVYFSSLGTQYVGSSFKRDATVRFLGYSGTKSYGNMSLSYTVTSSTVTKFQFNVAGDAIKIVSPNPLTRNDYLSQRGQESATRPKFICDNVGSGTVEFQASLTSTVKVVFQPENKTRVFTVNHTETTTRKGKCIALVSDAGDYNNGGDSDPASEEEALVAMGDPASDVLVWTDGQLLPALEIGAAFPAHVDVTGFDVALRDGQTLLATLSLDGTPPAFVPDDADFLCFHFLILDSEVGETGFEPFQDALWDLALQGDGAGAPLAASASLWNGGGYEAQPDMPLEVGSDGRTLTFAVALDDLGLTADEARGARYRAVTEEDLFVDQTENAL